MARLRCAVTETWVETTDLPEVLPMAQSCLLELQSSVNMCLNELEELQQSILQHRRSGSAFSPDLHVILQQQEQLKQKMKQAEEALRL